MKVGLIGCGNIGEFLLQSINIENLLSGAEIISVFSRRSEVADRIAKKYNTTAYGDMESFLNSGIDTVVEAATVEAVREYGLKILESGADLIVSSIGAMADNSFLEAVQEVCDEKNVTVLLPPGAVGGLDLLKSAKAMGELESVSLTTRKPPTALPTGEVLEAEMTLFAGPASEAIKKFPKNINVAIALSLAGLGPDRTDVKIIADPNASKNSHTIEAKGSFGSFKVEIENNPMPNNPKTSFLAALSVLSILQNKDRSVQIG
ncbi:aspartate dehydrogenase [Sporosarcina sp. 179-K 3D1 HS]|uniref:aspartate dehydrogenase n=1 Tax=Sporosarcina sp. 179-K 3D1 HS TaxID=3232169 RepID=UPI0039A1D5C9